MAVKVTGNALMEDLRKWVKEKWVDIGAPKKGGGYKPCGRSEGEKRKGYPKCVPAAKAAGMSKKQKKSAVKRKRSAGNPGGKPNMVSTFKKENKKREALQRFGHVIEEKLCAKGKAAAKRKYDVYPSAYANMYGSAVCSGKVKPGGKKRKDENFTPEERASMAKMAPDEKKAYLAKKRDDAYTTQLQKTMDRQKNANLTHRAARQARGEVKQQTGTGRARTEPHNEADKPRTRNRAEYKNDVVRGQAGTAKPTFTPGGPKDPRGPDFAKKTQQAKDEFNASKNK